MINLGYSLKKKGDTPMTKPSACLLNALADYANSNALPMHMPGHKRNTNLAPYLSALGAEIDITEIHGFDDLHQPEGILRHSMEHAARLWGSDRSFYLVNGSTCGILAGIRAAAGQGGKVILTRGCHKSVYHALELCSLTPHYIAPTLDPTFGVLNSITPSQVQQALNDCPDAKLIILTSPTYEGVISDLDSICQIAHAAQIPVLVDEAHGSHLGLAEGWHSGAVAAKADLVIQSLHKTLPSLTQTAILHQNGNLVSPQEVARQLGIFETSSPSYLLLSSIDGCVNYLTQHRTAAFAHWNAALQQFDKAIEPLVHLRVLCHGSDSIHAHTGFFAHDPGKLVISCRGTNLTGIGLMERLRNDYAIESEMASGDYALAMTGMGDSPETLQRLAAALCAIDQTLTPAPAGFAVPHALPLPPQVMPVLQALQAPCTDTPFADCVGKISGEYVWAYPPGIPLIVPGERLDEAFYQNCCHLLQSGISLRSTSGNLPHHLSTLV